jgi:tetratricopeptide (TPR) repeat protein
MGVNGTINQLRSGIFTFIICVIYAVVQQFNGKGAFAIFNSDFYPTPDELIEELLALSIRGDLPRLKGISRFTLRGRVLEPSAGKGNIVNYIRSKAKSIKVDAIENDPELSSFLIGAGHNIVWSDFTTFETFREYDAIVMNPPFSACDKHLLHAVKLASKQITKDCEIYAIINAETIRNPFSTQRKELLRLLDLHDARIEFVEKAFSEAERKTNVKVALIYLKVRRNNASEDLYRRTVDAVKGKQREQTSVITTALSTFVKHQEIQERADDITRLINEYEQAIKLVREVYEISKRKKDFISYISNLNGGKLFVPSEDISKGYEEELQRLRSTYWQLILHTDKFMKMLTTEAREKLNRQLESASELEINTTNIYMLLHAIMANSNDMLISSVVSMFEKITSYSRREFSTNMHYYNGWYTNEAYKIGKKIIYPFFTSFGDWDMGTRDNSFNSVDYRVKGFIFDLLKAFEPFRDVSYEFVSNGKGEFSNEILRFKIFMKGTVHVWFNDLETLNKINYVCGRNFNWLPSEDEIKTNDKAREYVVKEFGEGALSIKLLSA